MELVTLEGLLGDFVVFDAQPENGFAVRVRDEGVEIIDIQFGFEQDGHEPAQFGRGSLNGDQAAFHKRITILRQELTSGLRVVHDDPDNGAIGLIQNHYGKDVNSM